MQCRSLRKTFHFLESEEHKEDIQSLSVIDFSVIMGYLVKISTKALNLELKRRHLKITVLIANKLYPSRKIRRIRTCTSPDTTKNSRAIRRIQDEVTNTLEDIERGPYSKKPPIRRIGLLQYGVSMNFQRL
ncbi:hypothetical protein Tco_0309452 [Tanacetum coccineum]